MTDRINKYQQLIAAIDQFDGSESIPNGEALLDVVYDSLKDECDMNAKYTEVEIDQSVAHLFDKNSITDFVTNVTDVEPRVFLLICMKYLLVHKKYSMNANSSVCINECGLRLGLIVHTAQRKHSEA